MRVVGRGQDDERGSAMIVAITVILIISTLSVAALTRTLAGLKSSRQSQDFQAALGKADSGVSDALFRLDQTGFAPIEGMCPTADPPPCTVTNLPGDIPGTNTMYTLEKIDTNTVRIRSKGITNGEPHGAEAIAYRSILFPFAVFGDSSLEFSGNPNPITSSPDTTATTAIGTNGAITCNPSNPADSSFVFPPSASSACGAQVGSGVYQPLEPTTTCPSPPNTPSTPCLPATYSPCPISGGILNATITGATPPRAYRCDVQVVFPATVTITGGAVELFIFPPPGVAPFDLDESTVNYTAGGVPDDAGNFRLYAAGSGAEVTSGSSNTFKFSGVLWAPGVTLRGNGCKSDYNGAIIVKEFDCNGGPNLNINYDTRLFSLVDKNWRIRDYAEIPSSSVVPLL